MIHLTEEQLQAIREHPNGVRFSDPDGKNVYFVFHSNLLNIEDESKEENLDWKSIAIGIAQMKMGQGKTIEQSKREMMEEFNIAE